MILKKAKWIACDESLTAPIVVKQFLTKEKQKAIIRIFGLGYYELFINGKRIGSDFFKPVLSDYAERDFTKLVYPSEDRTSHSVYYNTYKIDVEEGENTIAVMLGNGFYRQHMRLAEGDVSFGDKLILCFAVSLKNDLIITDGSEYAVKSFITDNNVFYGETHDYSLYDEDVLKGITANKKYPVEVVSPTAVLRKQVCPNEKIVRYIKPEIIRVNGNKTIYDAGENITGFVVLDPLSDAVSVLHAETIKGDNLDFSSTGGEGQVQCVKYLNAAGKKRVHPWFHWSAFRYFETEGIAKNIEVAVVNTSVKRKIHFKCGNDILNWLFDAYIRTQTGALHGGITMDCPHRERLGYTGDGQLIAESAMLCLTTKEIFKKWMRDIADCQDIDSGHIQHTAPMMGGGGGPGGWGCAVINVPYAYYKIYGEKDVLFKYYTNMLRYIDCMKTFCRDGLVVREREGGWCLGEWCTPEKVKLPEPFVNTFYFIRSMERVSEIAKIIGKEINYFSLIEKCKTAIRDNYYDKATGEFCNGVQGANIFALLLGLGDERTKNKALEKYRNNKYFDTGIFGTDLLTEYLRQEKEIQLLYDLLTGEEFPSFGYMKKNGATTLWEGWKNEGSLNHPMLGGCIKQIIYGIMGITGDAGFTNVNIDPPYIEGIGFIEAEMALGNGFLKLRYDYDNRKAIIKCKTTGNIKINIKS